MSRPRVKGVLVALLATCAMESAAADNGALTLTLENDSFAGSDNNYTNGIGISWVSADLDTYDRDGLLAGWGRFWGFLPFVSDDRFESYAAWSLAQEMHTPDDIDDPDPPEDDQPYAGVLYLDSLLYAKKERWAHAWALKLGVVGPASQADDVQKWVHKVIGSDEPEGWSTQLPNEPVINLGYTAAYVAAAGDAGGWAEWRLIPVAHVGLGTYFTGASLGVYGEFGWNLVEAFGETALRSGLNAASSVGVGPLDGWSVSFFGGLAGFGVGHYLPLDGTVFRDSRSVDSEPFIGMASLGVSVRYRRIAVGLGETFFTKTFDKERERSEFGTVSLSLSF